MMLAGCPDCPAARAARSLLLHDGFWTHLASAVLPFALVVLVVMVIVQRTQRRDG
jgi:hypothetical protein